MLFWNMSTTINCFSCNGLISYEADQFIFAFRSGDRLWGQEIKCPYCSQTLRLYQTAGESPVAIYVKIDPKTTKWELFACYLMAFFLPLFGLIIGIYLWNWRKRSGHGGLCILIALLANFWVFLMIYLTCAH